MHACKKLFCFLTEKNIHTQVAVSWREVAQQMTVWSDSLPSQASQRARAAAASSGGECWLLQCETLAAAKTCLCTTAMKNTKILAANLLVV
jgi:hypothetical protein